MHEKPTGKENKHWKAYVLEAAGIAGFVIIGGLVTIFSEHPNMPLMESWLKNYPLLRRIPLAFLLGGYIIVMSLLIGKRSGAHINPAVTWTFYRLGNIKFKDAVLYTAAQFVGAVSGAFLLKLLLDNWFSHPNIHYGITRPIEPHSNAGAFIGESIISFIAMWVILIASSSKKLEKKLPFLMGFLIAVFIIFELPYSGMSMNPARSFAGAAAANKWGELWIYFVAPFFAMLLAGELYQSWKRRKITAHILKPGSKKDDLQKINEFPAR